jgi:excisionase family DNA binding protein
VIDGPQTGSRNPMSFHMPQQDDHSRAPREPVAAVGLMTIRDVAKFVGCSVANVYGLIETGELPVIAIGKTRGYRVDRRDMEEFLCRRKQHKAAAPSKPPRPKLKHIRLP